MKPLALEWVEKAEGDFTTAMRELRARRAPNGETADKTEAKLACKSAEMARQFFTARLGIR